VRLRGRAGLTARRIACAAALAVLVAAGCTRAPNTAAVRAAVQQLTIDEPAEPTTLNPMLSNDTLASYLGPLVFSYLLDIDDHNELVPDVAAGVPAIGNGISADGLTITYHLRRGVRWQDGTPLGPQDVIFTYQAVMDPANAVPDRGGYDQVASIAAHGDDVVVRLRRKYPPFVGRFLTLYPILPEHVLAHSRDLKRDHFNIAPVGSGPYVVESWTHGDRIVYKANARYWRGPPKLRTIDIRFVPSTYTIVTQLQTYEADAWFGASSNAYPRLKALPGYTVSLIWATGFTCFDLNLKDPVLRDVRVRRALALALDRARMVLVASHGIYAVTDSDQTPLSWAYDPHGPRIAYDPDAARRLLDEAGWHVGPDGVRVKDGRRLELQLAYMSGYATAATIAAMAQAYERAVGVAVDLKVYPEALLEASAADGGIMASGKYQMGFEYKPAEGVDPDDSSLWGCDYMPPNGLNNTFWCDRAVDGALRAALSTYDRAKRRQYYAIVQRAIAEQVPVILLYRGQASAIYPDSLHGVVRSSAGSDFWSVWQWHY